MNDLGALSSTKKPVLLVSANFFPKIGGPASSVPEIARILGARGYDVHVLTSMFPGFSEREQKDGFTLWRAPSPFQKPNEATALQNLRAAFGLAQKIRELNRVHRFSFVHCHDLNLSTLAAFLSFSGLPVISKFTGDLSVEQRFAKIRSLSEFEQAFGSMPHLRASGPWSMAQRVLASHPALITAPSNFQLAQLRAMGVPAEKCVMLPNGIAARELEGAAPLIAPEPPRILYYGRLVAWKGIHRLLDAFDLLAPRFPSARLDIVGNGPLETELRSRAQKSPHAHRILFEPAMPHAEMLERVRASHVIVLPSLYDPFPHGMLEVLGLSKPLVASRVDGIAEVVSEQTGWPVAPNDARALCEALETVLRNPTLARERAKNGAALVRARFTWEALVTELEKIYAPFFAERSLAP